MSSKNEIADKLKEAVAASAPVVVVEASQAPTPTPISNPSPKGGLNEEEKADPLKTMTLEEETEIVERVLPSNQMETAPHYLFKADHLRRMALLTQAFWNSGYFNERFKNKTQMFVVLTGGFDMGLSPMNAINDTALIKGKLTIHSRSKIALVQNHPRYAGAVCEWFGGEPLEMVKIKDLSQWSDDFGCRYKVWQVGIAEPEIGEWSVAMAKRAGNWNPSYDTPWKTHPFHMFKTRAFDQATRIIFASGGARVETTEIAIEIARSNGTITTEMRKAEADAIGDGE